MNEKNEDLVEIKGLNIHPAMGLPKVVLEERNVKFIIIGENLKYAPDKISTSIMIRKQEAFDLAIDIIGENPLLLFAYFKRKFNLTGGTDHGEEKVQEKKNTAEEKKEIQEEKGQADKNAHEET